MGSKFIIKTNDNNLRPFLSQKELNDRKYKGESNIQDFNFGIEYKNDKMNVVVDSLYIKPILSLKKFHDDLKLQLGLNYGKNHFYCDLFDGLIHVDYFKILNYNIYHNDIIFLVLESSLMKKILDDSHDAPLVGHPIFLKTYMKVR